MNDVKYSVLMSVYKKEKASYFDESIKSMIEQTLKPDQIVIVKDGPLSLSLEKIIEKYVGLYPQLFTIIRLEKNSGLGIALNRGLKNCRNDLVARMDTDDISFKNRCELQVNEFRNNKHLSILGSYIDEFNKDKNTVIATRTVPLNHEDIIKFSRRRNPFNHPTVMFKKKDVLSVGGYKDFKRNQDLDLFVRMLIKGYRAKNINKSLVLFRANEDNLKRRKSWIKCWDYIRIIYNFWRWGHSNLWDLIVVASSQLLVFIAPSIFLNWISKSFLRQNKVS